MEPAKHYFLYEDSSRALRISEYVYTLGTFHYNWHEDIELLVILRGRAELCNSTGMHPLEADDLVLINSNEGHASLARSADCLAFLIHIAPSVFSLYDKNYRALRFRLATGPATRQQLPCRLLRMNMAKMLLAMEDPARQDLLRLQSGLYPLLELLYKEFRDESPARSGVGSKRNQLLVQHMTRYIEEHYQEKLTLNSLADEMGYNASYLSQLFRDNVGVNFYEYVTRKRLRESTFELQHTDKKVLAIAADNGFQDVKAFNSKFREVFGRTPSEYRRTLSAESGIPRWSVSSKAYVDRSDPFVLEKLQGYLHPEKASPACSDAAALPPAQAVPPVEMLEDVAAQLEQLAARLKGKPT